MSTATISVGVDEDLKARLYESENRSLIVRSALRQYYEGDGFELDLSERESNAYDELLKLTRGGGRIRKDVAETVIARVVGLEKAIVRHAIFRPLENVFARHHTPLSAISHRPGPYRRPAPNEYTTPSERYESDRILATP